MDFNIDLIFVGIMLIPGINVMLIVSYLTESEYAKFDKFDKFFGALVSSVLVYFFYRIISKMFCVVNPIIIEISANNIVIHNFRLKEIGIIFLISTILGAIIAFAYEKDIILHATNYLGLTNKLSGTVWNKTLKKYRDKWVKVYLDDGTYYIGWVEYFSVKEKRPSIFLREAEYFSIDNKRIDSKDISYDDGVLIGNSIKKIVIYNIENKD